MERKAKKFVIILLIFGLLFLIFLAYSIGAYDTCRSSSETSTSCKFCDFAHHKQGPPPILLVEEDDYVIFKDIAPAAKHHYLAIPKQHHDSLNVLNKSHIELVNHMEQGLIKYLTSQGVDPSKDTIIGFHVPPFISVNHLHLHGISPATEMSFLNRINFMESFWFKSAKAARDVLNDREL